ncbi:hypothetical protein V6U78_04535 [Marinospirillum sp. MEB164]|uniref:Lipoprotein n=1 Tax=Marinospirillum alkalitolerans TaxID=3123374 RepID=A0ABW8PWW8_9GAMM
MKKIGLVIPWVLLLAACGVEETPVQEPVISIEEWRTAIQNNDTSYEARAEDCYAAFSEQASLSTDLHALAEMGEVFSPSCRHLIDAFRLELNLMSDHQ